MKSFQNIVAYGYGFLDTGRHVATVVMETAAGSKPIWKLLT